METVNQPLIVIVGETASGKSALALEIAQKFNGEIICADAMTVYKEFTIGTAKPSSSEQGDIRHHLVDVTTAREGYSAPQFQRAALEAIKDISTRGKLPVVVGGTGLYIDSLLYGYSFLDRSSSEIRQQLDAMELAELIRLAEKRKLSLAHIDQRNKRRVIRLIENNGAEPQKTSLRSNTLILGVELDKDVLVERITARVTHMIAAGLEDEVKMLSQKYGWEVEPMKAIGYREWREYFAGQQTREQTMMRIISGTRRLAKKQRTWFGRNNSIHWINNREEAVASTTTFLNKYSKNHS